MEYHSLPNRVRAKVFTLLPSNGWGGVATGLCNMKLTNGVFIHSRKPRRKQEVGVTVSSQSIPQWHTSFSKAPPTGGFITSLNGDGCQKWGCIRLSLSGDWALHPFSGRSSAILPVDSNGECKEDRRQIPDLPVPFPWIESVSAQSTWDSFCFLVWTLADRERSKISW